ncbi:DUF4126 domain-containing protein [Gloeobacter morelensis]|uniref:DUF4126 domain-containing protein n=1 Tax=Gloeobacter morelensis MG652769 TaxID=2781736 RepID=A0ABY3PQ37_9CYAN|nr:DUF4126 domain-containing protein [Gloeobacter morelensis]UFP95825.1 DUF4126 domain-containing protein [Gloeobacter morelensis MG652769]
MLGATSLTRGASSVETGGLANPVLSAVELLGSVLMSALAIFVPVLAALVAAIVVFVLMERRRRFTTAAWGY